MSEIGLEQHAINANFQEPNFSTKTLPILPMGDNLNFPKITFYSFTVYLLLII